MVLEAGSYVGISLAVLAAFGFALQFIFVRLGTENGSVTDVVLVSLLCNTVIIVPAAVILSSTPLSFQSAIAFAAAGICGSLLARIFMFTSVRRIGASRTSPIVSSNVMFATLFAFFFLDERLSVIHLLGILLLVGGIAYISYESSGGSQNGGLSQFLSAALVLPLLAALFIGLEPIFISLGFADEAPLLPGLAVNVSAALIGFTAYVAFRGELPTRELLHTTDLKWHVGAGLATTIALLAYFSALESAPVVLVVPVVQTSPLIVVALSAVILPSRLERVSWRLITAALIVVIGATVVSLHG
ncbi:EamA family transporter [Natrialbaceae archaeon A-CW3]